MFDYTGKAALANISQNCVFTWEIPEKCWLADLKDIDNIVDAGILIALLAEKSDSSLDNLLAQSNLLAFSKAKYLVRGSRFFPSPQASSILRVCA
jgi:hypothetical protein